MCSCCRFLSSWASNAAKWQVPIGGYGPENIAKLKATSRKYDLFRIFWKGMLGGFKLGV